MLTNFPLPEGEGRVRGNIHISCKRHYCMLVFVECWIIKVVNLSGSHCEHIRCAQCKLREALHLRIASKHNREYLALQVDCFVALLLAMTHCKSDTLYGSSFAFAKNKIPQLYTTQTLMDDDIIISAALTIPMSEIAFATSRSGGPGGQHVNKTETRVELTFDMLHSLSLSEYHRGKILRALAGRIDGEGILHITASEERSQFQNKHRAIERFRELLAAAIRPRKNRIATRPSVTSREKRIQGKKIVSRKKTLRRNKSDE